MKKKMVFLLVLSLIFIKIYARELNIDETTPGGPSTGFYGGDLPRKNVVSITFTDSITIPEEISGSYDGSKEKDRSVMVWYKNSNELSSVFVGSESGINAPRLSENLFAQFPNLKKIDISKLNMSNVEDIDKVFKDANSLEKIVIKKSNIIKLDNFATSVSNKYLVLSPGIDSGEVKNIKDKDNHTKTGIVKTGDKIGSNDVVVLGDVNSDGEISSMDYVKVKNHIMEINTLIEKIKLLAADYNDDDNITSMDYVKVKKYIMNEEENDEQEISFNLNGGQGDTDSYLKIKSGVLPILKRNKPQRIGYEFMGWYDNSDYTKGNLFYDKNLKGISNIEIKASKILYAGWKKIEQTETPEEPEEELTGNILSIQYNGNGGLWNNPTQGSNYFMNASGFVISKGNNEIYNQKIKLGDKLPSTGLIDCDGEIINFKKNTYVPKSGHEYYVLNGSTKTELSQNKDYTASELASYSGCNLAETSCTIVVYVNWVNEIIVPNPNPGVEEDII